MVITLEEATELVDAQLRGMEKAAKGFGSALPGYVEQEIELIISKIDEHGFGWVFFWSSKKWVEDNNFEYALAGNAPFLVERNTGRLITLGTSDSPDNYIARYLKYGDPHAEPVNAIVLIAVSEGCREIDVVRLIRDHSEYGLAEVMSAIKKCAAGKETVVLIKTTEEAIELADQLCMLGVTARVKLR